MHSLDIMASNASRTSYSLRFLHEDPMAREATSRTHRYRILKKRKRDSSEVENTHDTTTFDFEDESATEEVLPTLHSPDGTATEDRSSVATDITIEQEGIIDLNFTSDPLNDLLPEESVLDECDNEEGTDTTCTGSLSFASSSSSATNIPQSSVLIMQYSFKHNLTQEAVTDLLKLLKTCSPDACDSIPPSLYHFKKQFSAFESPPILHYFCNEYYQKLSGCDCSLCNGCGTDLSTSRALSSFIEISLASQLVKLLERKFVII